MAAWGFYAAGLTLIRIAIGSQGKRSSFRTILIYRSEDKAFFVYGFAKNKRVNISNNELGALKRLARELLAYNEDALNQAILHGALVEVTEAEENG